HPDFAKKVCAHAAEITGKDFVSEPVKFHSLTSYDELVYTHGALKALAADLMKIANDVRWLASGPRSGIGEITDRKSTRLNSSHVSISYTVFCWKKKNRSIERPTNSIVTTTPYLH